MQITSRIGCIANVTRTPGGGTCMISNQAIPVRIHKFGGSLCVILVKTIRDLLPWRAGDFVAVRVCGEKVVIERLALEKAAIIRTGEAQPVAGEL